MARGEGLRVRLSRIKGETPKGVLASPLYLPAVVGAFGWTEEALFSEYNTLSSGQFSQPAMGGVTARQLRTLDDIETLTVEWDPPWLVEQGQDPDAVYRELFAVLRARRGVELLATPKLGPDRPLLRANVTLRSITPQLRQGEPDTTYYTVRIKEWRRTAGARKAAGSDKLPTTHKLTAKDTLHSLSMRYYHSALYATDIAHANGIRSWGKATPLVKMARFKVGSKVKIPKVYKASVNPHPGATAIDARTGRPVDPGGTMGVRGG